MKTKYLAMLMAVVLSVGLVGCSRRNQNETNSPAPNSTPSASVPGNIGQENDSFEGGGAGGTNDGSYSDVTPRPSHSADVGNQDNNSSETGDGVLDDIGNAAGDLIDGAGEAVRDAGNAIGDAANNVRGAVQR